MRKTFPLSLQGPARDSFLYQQNPLGGWQEMQWRFLNRYLPPSTTTSFRREITTIGQFQEEGLLSIGKGLKGSVHLGPNHQISDPRLLVYFYEGLLYEDKMLVDAAAEGSLLDKTPNKARKLLCKLVGSESDELLHLLVRILKGLQTFKIQKQS